jgi:multidrug resistance efflux pump
MKTIRWILRLLPAGVACVLLLVLALVFFCRIERTVEARGEIRVRHYSVVRPQVAGLVVQVKAEPGDLVKRGQALIQLQDNDLQRELISARQRLAEARSRLHKLLLEQQIRSEAIHPLEIERQRFEIDRSSIEAALSASKVVEMEIELDAARQRHLQAAELARSGLISQRDLQQARQAELSAEQRLRQGRLQQRIVQSRRPFLDNELRLLQSEQRRSLGELEASLRECEAELGEWTEQWRQLERLKGLHTLRASMDGVVIGSSTNELLGQHVQAGQELFSVIDVSSIFFVTHVPEQALVRVRSGQPAYVEIAGLPKNQFKLFPGRVGKVSQEPELDPEGKVPFYPVQIQMSNPWIALEEGRFYLRSGMRGSAKIAYRRNVPVLEAIYEFLIGKPQIPARERGHPKSPLLARSTM